MLAGAEAGRLGRPNPVKRDDVSDAGLLLFHAWHLATVERQAGTKFIADVPADNDELRICKPKASR